MRERGRASGAALLLLLAGSAALGVTSCRGRGAPQAAGVVQSLGPFRVGETRRGPIALTLGMTTGQASSAKTQKLRVSGEWATTPTDIHDGSVEIACRLSQVRVALEGAGPATDAAARAQSERELAAALEAPQFFVTAGAGGALSGLWLPRDVNPAVANVLVTLIGAQQLVQPDGRGPAWIVQEEDANGAYLAAYQELAPDRFKKQKARYLPPGPQAVPSASALAAAGPAAAPPQVLVTRSEQIFTTAPGGRVRAVQGAETLALSLGQALSFTVDVELRLDAPTVEQTPALAGELERTRARLQWRALQAGAGAGGAGQAQFDRTALAGADWSTLVAALDALPAAAAADGDDASRLQRRFVALFRLEPTKAAEAPAYVRAALPARGKVLVDALSLAGTAPAALALAAIAGDARTPASPRQYALQYLAHQRQPPPAAVEAVAALMDQQAPQLRQMALLTYGACALNLRGGDPARADAIVSALLARLANAPDDDARADIIVALGNAGSARALPALRPPIERRDRKLGLRAVTALRFIDDADVDPLVQSLLRLESDAAFRRAAIGVVRYRELGPFADALAELARRDPDANTRNAAVTLLGDRLATLPALRPVLEDVRKTDKLPANRQLAARYLDQPARR